MVYLSLSCEGAIRPTRAHWEDLATFLHAPAVSVLVKGNEDGAALQEGVGKAADTEGARRLTRAVAMQKGP